MDHYNQHWVNWFSPRNSGGFAITLGQHTFYSVPKEQVSQPWRDHEDCHKVQFLRYGVVVFFALYVYHYLYWRLHGKTHWDAYNCIPLEVEARDTAARKAERRARANLASLPSR